MPNEFMSTVEAFLFSGWFSVNSWWDVLILAALWYVLAQKFEEEDQ